MEHTNLQAREDVKYQSAGSHVQVEAALIQASPGEVVLLHVMIENLLHQTLFLEIYFEQKTKLALRINSRRMSLLKWIYSILICILIDFHSSKMYHLDH